MSVNEYRRCEPDPVALRTVGDLLDHFPRRYLETGELSALESLEEGQLLTVVGEVEENGVHSYTDRRTDRTAYRVDVVVRTEGTRLRMSSRMSRTACTPWPAGSSSCQSR